MNVRTALILVLVILCLVVGVYLQFGGWMMWNPKYSEGRLRGLTSAEVVQKLGTPSSDPRVPFFVGKGPPPPATQPLWIEERDGHLVLGYFNNAATCRIEFANDRVIKVERYWK